MAALLLLLLLSAIYAGDAQQRQTNITLGSSLTPTSNSSWFSPSGSFAFGFYNQTNGYAIGIYLTGMSSKTAVWTANRDNNPIDPDRAVLLLNNDGRLIVQQSQAADIEIISRPQKIDSASMLDNGNFVLYNSDRKVMWQSFDHPTNTILPGQRLTPGQVLFSSVSATDDSTGIFRLIMQQDGWLVQYPVLTPYLGPYAYYTDGVVGGGNNVTLNLGNDGRLYLLNSTMKIKDLSTGGNPTQNQYLMKIDVDGIFRLYSHSLDQGNLSVIWSSTTDRCSPKGICGLNGYCTQFDDKIKCECLPGFDYVNPSDWTAGCERNFTAESSRIRHSLLQSHITVKIRINPSLIELFSPLKKPIIGTI